MDKKEVVVKFVRSHYGKAVHEFLADNAPKLIQCRLLPGGWYAVVMEQSEGTSFTAEVSQTVKQSLRNAVDLMHQNNYVHGDLRQQNILIVSDTVHIVDFDWADTEDAATYPPEVNMNEECYWHPNVKPGGKILKVHDTYQLDSICNS